LSERSEATPTTTRRASAPGSKLSSSQGENGAGIHSSDVKRSSDENSLEKQPELVAACKSGDLEIVKQVLASGKASAVAADGRTGLTPLMVAAVSGQGAVVTELIQNHNADPDRADEHGCTALHRAAEEGRVDAVAALVAGGADLDIENYEGCTALQLSEAEGHDRVSEMLC